ncbi:MAG: hypothetical protein K0U98_20745 [Deltaproteobacteria bacterium]|nr:hypothetical protein [Deltaproteobacteria bacterium]
MRPPLDTTHLLSRSIGVLGNDLGPILAWSLLLQAPRVLISVLSDTGRLSFGDQAGSVLALLVALLPMVILTQLQTAVLAPRVLHTLREDGFGPPTEASTAGSSVIAILITAVAVAVLAVAGFALFLIPGWLVLTGLFVAVPALMCEGLSPQQALIRSWRLTGPRGISIFTLVFLFTLVEALLRMALTALGAPATLTALAAVPISAVQAIAATVTYAGLVARHDDGETQDEPQAP